METLSQAGSLAGAEQMAGGFSRLGLYYLAGVEAAVIVALFAALLWSWSARIRDVRKLLTETLRTVNQNADSHARFARALEAKWPRVKRPPEEPPP